MEAEGGNCAGQYSYASDDTDPTYLIFLENAIKDGTSYMLKVGEENLKYEEEDVFPDDSSLDECDTQGGSRVNCRISKKNSRTVDKGKNKVTEDVRNMGEEDYVNVLNSDILFSDDDIEEDYISFLEGHQITEKGNMTFCYNGRWLVYEDDSDSDVCVIDPRTFEKEDASNPFVLSKVFNAYVEEDNNQHLGSSSGSSQSQFREQLVRDLQRSYDQTEHERLLDEISARKPIECEKDLRNGSVRVFSSDKDGKSYLDYYGDMQQKLKDAKDDKHKQLKLLRGFFFYLKNLSQEGSFKPWQDQSPVIFPHDVILLEEVAVSCSL